MQLKAAIRRPPEKSSPAGRATGGRFTVDPFVCPLLAAGMPAF